MANPLYQELSGNRQGGPAASPQNDPTGGFAGMVQQLRQYASGFQGHPTQELQKMLSSGQMNQQQYNQLRNVAQRIAQMLPH